MCCVYYRVNALVLIFPFLRRRGLMGFGYFDRNITFVQVLAMRKITLLEDLLLGCLIFLKRKVLKISGLFRRMDYRAAKSLIRYG